MWRTCEMYRCVARRLVPLLTPSDAAQPLSTQRRWASNIKMTKQLHKMLNRHGNAKKKIFQVPVNVNSATTMGLDLNPRKKPTYTEGQKRRAHQVGRVLYDYIVQLVNSGELCPELAAMSVDIVQVKVIPNFSAVNVYWLTSGSGNDDAVERLLRENEGALRQRLTSLHLLGTIPRITFVRDNSRAHFLEVDSLLSGADFGPDFEPTKLDSAIRDSAYTKGKEGKEKLSLEISLQEEFNNMSIQDSERSAQNLLMSRMGHSRKQGVSSAESMECNANDTMVHSRQQGIPSADSVERDTNYTSDSETVRREVTRSPNERTNTVQADNGSVGTHFPSPNSASLGGQADGTVSAADENKCRISGDNQTASGNSATNPDQSITDSPSTFSPLEGFRDDMYGVPHSSLVTKILARKQRQGIRLSMQEQESNTEFKPRPPRLDPSRLSKVVQLPKIRKLKGKVRTGSDYDWVSREEVHFQSAREDGDYVEERMLHDEEPGDNSQQKRER